MKDLEDVLREAISEGQPRTHRPWKNILIIVEGLYSMEGEMCNLKAIVQLKKKYKAILYVDEAHSIGALGKTGRGVCEELGVNFDDVDILMGTFTKSFGSVGGYVASSVDIVHKLRYCSPGMIYATSMAPACAQQALSALRELQTESGLQRVSKLHSNSNFFRAELQKLGLCVLGAQNSPVIPVLVCCPAKMPVFSRMMLERNVALVTVFLTPQVAVVIVGFPATPLFACRVRFCISAAHSEVRPSVLFGDTPGRPSGSGQED